MRRHAPFAIALLIVAAVIIAFARWDGRRDGVAAMEAKCRAAGLILLTGRDLRSACVSGFYP